MEYYYTPKKNIDISGKSLFIDGDFEYRHLAKVLRKKPGDSIDVTDGELNIYRCEITDISKEQIRCNIKQIETDLYEPDKRIHLYIAPLKNLDRYEFAVEKAVELGVYSVTPVITERTINKSIFNETKLNRLHRISISAMGQSQRCFLPKINNIIKFDDLLDSTMSNKNRIVMYEFSEKDAKFVYDDSSRDVFLLIGPEGGFSEVEVDRLKNSGWQAGSLGERKLRAETAAVVAVFEILNCN
ncbi:MAG: 16S rRNA (uracil(1498)-N(3))-methyltransferase [Ignavibacteriae bacterium]|nr:16S rRNA (uracil(1498)-N(3))-methyltransferase [Ignavibacteriota bacterium]MCB0723394.1 16S rRNA (uracil(1498)-N(3))-methyltransferase [Ignavibacteriota bacterium]MCB9243240.1 16S rRNA (uracil(1498)-N(3))-methyltransferase [Ignavibacteriales bacterium]